MKKFFSLIASVSALVILAVSCGEKEPVIEYLEVNKNNISGTWSLKEWNGAALKEGSFLRMELIRDDGTFRITENLDSFEDIPRVVTGRYSQENYDDLGAVISGDYDHDSGFWTHSYVIRDLTSLSMTWIAVDDENFVQVFERCSE